MTGLIDFSANASENEASAPPINWQEGMPANAVNNSARELMAALARWRTDNSGGLGIVLSSNAATLTTAQGIKESHFASGFSIVFAATQTNTGPVTLNIDGTGARPWRRPRSAEFGPGDIVPFQIHTVVWSPSQGAYVSLSPSFETPGKLAPFASAESIPSGWVECNGNQVLRSEYAALFSAIGTTHGAGNGTTTFNVPDMRGRTMFGRDNGVGRLTGAGGLGGAVGNVGGSETVALNGDQMPAHSHSGSTSLAGGHDHGGATGQTGQHNHGGSTGGAGAHSHTGSTSAAGSHAHGGTTSTSGGHIHDLGYEKLAIYGNGGLTAVSQLFPPGNNSTAATNGAGDHQHSITTDTVGDHTHNFTTSSVGDHAHTIGADGNHAHTITGVNDHTHNFVTANAGGGLGHPNMPPGFVGVFAIKA